MHVDKIIPQKERIMDNFKKQVDKIVAGDYNPIVVDCDNKIINGSSLGSRKIIRIPRNGCC